MSNKNILKVVLIIIILALVFSVFWTFFPDWLGFGKSKVIANIFDTEVTIFLPEKTFWDWLLLLGTVAIPIILLTFSNNFQQQLKEKEQDELKESALQGYLDDISTLLLDRNVYESKSGDPIQDIIQIKTQTIIRRLNLDFERQQIIILFLLDSSLMPKIYSSLIIPGAKIPIGQLKINRWNLKKIIFPYLNFNEVYLYEADLSEAFLIAANFSGGYLSGANFSRADLSKANLSGAYLTTANFFGTKLSRADLSRAKLFLANFQEADLFGVNFFMANLEAANFSKANLQRANLSGVQLKGANLVGANLFEVKLVGANLFETNLSEANLSEVELQQANLVGANLFKVNLIRADLFGTNLSGANLFGVDFGEASLVETYFYQTKSLHIKQLKQAYSWEKAIYTEAEWNFNKNQWIPKDRIANKAKIEEIRKLKDGIVMF